MRYTLFAIGLLVCLSKVCNGQTDTSDICRDVVSKLDCSLDPPRNICGTDLVTYPTSCDFAKAHCQDLNLHIKYEGECQVSNTPDPICSTLITITCPDSNNPVCASDGNTYSDFCHYEQAKCTKPSLSLINLGACPTTAPTTPGTTLSIFDLICQSIVANGCPTGLPMVCGSNGVTYDSACDLEKAQCSSSTSITFVKEGPC